MCGRPFRCNRLLEDNTSNTAATRAGIHSDTFVSIMRWRYCRACIHPGHVLDECARWNSQCGIQRWYIWCTRIDVMLYGSAILMHIGLQLEVELLQVVHGSRGDFDGVHLRGEPSTQPVKRLAACKSIQYICCSKAVIFKSVRFVSKADLRGAPWN